MLAEAEDTSTTKGRRFVKLYDAGLERVGALLKLEGGPTVGRLWLLLVKHMGHDNALVVSNETLADALGVSDRSIRRAVAVLVESGAVVVFRIGSGNCYVLNDGEVWKTAEDHHRFCSFRAKTLVGFKENPGLRARLTHIRGQAARADARQTDIEDFTR